MPPSPAIDLRLGDCLDILPTLEAGSVDLVCADLPYGTTACKWDSIIPLAPLWAEYRRLLRPRGAVVLTASQPFTSALVASNLKWFRYEWIWIKNRGSNFGAARYQPLKEHESILVFARGAHTYNPQMQERTGGGASRVSYPFRPSTGSAHHTMPHSLYKNVTELRLPSSWQKFNTEVGLHPTQKPVALLEYLIRTYSNEGDLVLDNTMGSGTAGEACLNTGRRFIGIERDEGYFNIAERRLAAVGATPRQQELEIA